MSAPVTERRVATPGALRLRPAPSGLPDPNIAPPTIAEAGDPFAEVRILHLLARVERGQIVRIDDLVDHLNATYLDWIFTTDVVAAALVQLQSNWMADYRNSSGILVEDGPYGPTVALEDSSRVDPWIVRQVERRASACRERLLAFSLRDRVTSEG